MKIAYLFNSSTPSTNPGSIQVVNTCGAISGLSHDVRLVVPNTGKKSSLSKFYGIKNKISLIKINYFKKFPLGINYYLFSIISVIYGIFNNIELYITRNFFTLFFLNIFNKKVIIEVHHDLNNESRIVKFIYKNFDIFNKTNVIKVIAITNSVKKYLINNFNINKKKISVIPSASSLSFNFSKLKKKEVYKIGYFGSLDKTKGSNFIIALSKIDKKNKYFIYGGQKHEVNKLKKTCPKNLSINSSIPYGKIKSYIAKMDILVIPSNTKKVRSLGGIGNIAKFTSPLKLFDYLASGKLIMVSDLKVFKEILENNKTCLIIKRLDVNLWFKVIKNLKLNISKVNKIKKNAFLLSKQFTYLERAKKILDEY